ncbi:MAG: GNAT family N-acetyltransferase [Thermoplasmata archaeon]|nr:GNAT family N-acetyltransferase [Thermoplasmata archaeon]
MELSTPRLLLRPWIQSDASDLFSLASDPAIGLLAGWKPHESVDESAAIIDTVFSKPLVFCIVSRASNRPVGCVELSRKPQILRSGPNDVELGYWVGQRYWNQGFATEASMEAIRYAFEVEGVQNIWCQTAERNPQSARVQEKCGFRFHHRGVFSNPFLGEVITVVSILSKKDWKRANS